MRCSENLKNYHNKLLKDELSISNQLNMGKFEVDRFVTAPDPDLICCVCYCILDDPLESPCQHVFCKVCISTWLNNRKSCPNCRARLRSSRLKPVLPIVRNMINRLQIRCENINNGCTHSVQLENYNSHIENCEYAVVQCRNVDCTEKLLRRCLNEHEMHCRYRLTKCEKGCELLIPVDKLTEHNCLSELKAKLQKVEDNLQTMTTKMTDFEKRLLTLEQNERNGFDRSASPVFRSLRRSPPLPWYSPSGPNRRSQNNDRSRQNSYNQNEGRWRRRRRNRSLSLLSSPRRSPRTPSRSRSRSPLSGGTWSRSNRSGTSTPLSVATVFQELYSDRAENNSTDDDSFYSEMNRSLTSLESTTDAVSGSPAQNIERSEGNVGNNNNSNTATQEDNASVTIVVSSSQPENNTDIEPVVLNTSSEVDLLSVESENREERDRTVRRSARLAASSDPNNSITDRTNEDSSSNQQSTPYSSVPVLSRTTIHDILNAPTESSGSDDSVWEPVTGLVTTDSSIEEQDEDSIDSASAYYSSNEHGDWGTFLLMSYDSSDTDDTWSWHDYRNNRPLPDSDGDQSTEQSRDRQDDVLGDEEL